MKNITPSHLTRHVLFWVAVAVLFLHTYLFITKGSPLQESLYNELFFNQTEELIGFLFAPLLFFLAHLFKKRAEE